MCFFGISSGIFSIKSQKRRKERQYKPKKIYIFLFLGNFYSWGYNNFGQLGLGHEANRFVPQKIEDLSDENIVISHIHARGSVSAAVTVDGKLYTWGQSKV